MPGGEKKREDQIGSFESRAQEGRFYPKSKREMYQKMYELDTSKEREWQVRDHRLHQERHCDLVCSSASEDTSFPRAVSE